MPSGRSCGTGKLIEKSFSGALLCFRSNCLSNRRHQSTMLGVVLSWQANPGILSCCFLFPEPNKHNCLNPASV